MIRFLPQLFEINHKPSMNSMLSCSFLACKAMQMYLSVFHWDFFFIIIVWSEIGTLK